MDTQLVMTVMAADRPGLVETLARVIAENAGNWLESRMAHLGGQFAGILRVSVPADLAEKLRTALAALERSGIKIHLEAGKADAKTIPTNQTRRAKLNLVGQDRPGIVRQISEAFARRGVNVEELTTECSSAPMTGETLFHTAAEVGIPAQCSVAELRAEFEKIAADLMVDIKLHEI
jgi:glycine cleavage system regulatory protein